MRIDQARCQRAAHAFTLIEVVVAMLVIGISVAAFSWAVCAAYDTVRFARENLRATEILTEKTEALRLYDWDQLTGSGFIPGTFAVAFDPVNTNSPGTTYNGTISIRTIPHAVSYADNMRLVTIALQWTSRSRPCARQFTTYVSRSGLQNYRY